MKPTNNENKSTKTCSAVEAIMRKELRLYFSTPTAYVFIASFVCVSAILFTIFNLIHSNSSVSLIFSFLPYLFVIMIPILTMRLMAEERALKTDQLLLTAPISVASIVCGKLFAALYIFGAAIIIMLMYPVILSFYSTVSWGIVLSNYIGFFLMGSAFIAIGIFVSSLTENQLVSAIVTIALLLASFLVSYGIKPSGIALIDAVLSAVSVPKHFDNFFIGIIDLVSVIYYLSVTAIFTLLTIYRTEKRRISR